MARSRTELSIERAIALRGWGGVDGRWMVSGRVREAAESLHHVLQARSGNPGI